MTYTEERFDVLIFDKATRTVTAVIGKNLPAWDGRGSGRGTAEMRVSTGEDRINGKFYCDKFPTGKYNQGDVIPN